MPSPNLGALRAVADRLDGLGLSYAFVGGSIVDLLLDEPGLTPVRPTDDFDVILGVVTTERYSDVEARIRTLGFQHDMRTGAPLCRWVLGDLRVDIMPTEGEALGLNTAWFKEALATATEKEFAHTKLNLISPVAFLATKHAAFTDRGAGDYFASHDLEDFITVIDGWENIIDEVKSGPKELRGYVIESIRSLMAATHLPKPWLADFLVIKLVRGDCRACVVNCARLLRSLERGIKILARSAGDCKTRTIARMAALSFGFSSAHAAMTSRRPSSSLVAM